jgi:predicted ATPase with chaperone activity
MICQQALSVPEAPSQLDELGVETSVIGNLSLKLAATRPQFTTEWAAVRLCLPVQLVEQVYWQLKQDQLIEVLGQEAPFNYRYAISQRGRESAKRLLEISGYVGPAPVSLESYAAMLQQQADNRTPVSLESVRRAISELVLPESAVQVAALATASGRSLFLFGPPGNGKTSVGQMLHKVLQGDLWIPYCIGIGETVIRIFDPQCHRCVDASETEQAVNRDRRWLRIHRPLLVAGGEMTMDELDLIYSPSLRFYESPPHVKANGGLFLIDDFGRQRVDPQDLLNRWIVPLERRVDFLTLNTGQKIEIPFELMLIVATNLSAMDVADPAFLRRMGYRLHLDRPSPEDYAEIFRRYAKRVGLEIPPDLIPWLLARYRAEERELRASEPRELVERARDICQLHERPFECSPEVMGLAWTGYFGNEPTG